jgi:protocatechuate 3,4-dioxygenase beta subunit
MKKKYSESGFKKLLGIKTIAIALALMFAMTGTAMAQEFNPAANISGMKFNDINNNGIKEPGELGLANWTINLISPSGAILKSTLTDSNGNYSFTGLESGNYTVGEVLQPGWQQTVPVGKTYNIALNGTDVTGVDFGNANMSIRLMQPNDTTRSKWIEEYNNSPIWSPSPNIEGPQILSFGLHTVNMANNQDPSLLPLIDYNAAQRNQGSCGNCWAWAGTGATEVALNVQENYFDRLSVQYLNSNYNGGSGNGYACNGGWLNDFTNFYSGNFMIPWSNNNANWQDGGTSGNGPTTVSAASITTTPRYSISSMSALKVDTQGVGQATAITNIKNAINQNKAVWFGFFLPNATAWQTFFDFWNNQAETDIFSFDYSCGSNYNSNPNQGGGHAVLIVGYDDTGPTPYWLVLNSWGTTANRPHGLFRIAQNINYDCTLKGLNTILGNSDSLMAQVVDVNFATPPTGSITGMKFNDLNGNGVKDAGEPGLASWTITLTDRNGVTTTQTTDGPGNYNFSGLSPGTYTVGEVLQPGWTQTAPFGGTYSVSLNLAENSNGNDFGNFELGEVHGKKFEDLNGNGVKDAGEPGLANWQIVLKDSKGNTVATTTTDSNGNYNFTGLFIGTYTVSEVMPIGWIQTAPAISTTGSATYTESINKSGTVITGDDFGNFQLGKVYGQKFQDLNANGIKDTDEVGLAGWAITVKGTDTITGAVVNMTTTTDANGNYNFTGLTAGTYTISETLRNGWVQTTPVNGTYTVNIISGSNFTGQDFGNFHKGDITGGGWINITGDPKATFGIVGHYPGGSNKAQGNIQYQDHISKLNINSIKINTVASTLDKKEGAITGLAQVNGAGSYPFVVYVQDNAEPGVGADVFRIVLPTYPYSNGAVLSGGNIQIHS